MGRVKARTSIRTKTPAAIASCSCALLAMNRIPCAGLVRWTRSRLPGKRGARNLGDGGDFFNGPCPSSDRFDALSGRKLSGSYGVCSLVAKCSQFKQFPRKPCAKAAPVTLLAAAAITGFNPALAQTWTQTTAPTSCWFSVASSADGNRLIAVDMERIWIFDHSGATWTPLDSPSNNWYCVSSSSDGTKLAAGVGFLVRGPIYASTDSGVTWTKTTAPMEDWSSLACSADGRKLVAVASGVAGGPICTSTDSGFTWAKTSAPVTNWISVASSADGTMLVAAVGYYTGLHGPIFVSVDSGLTWQATSAPVEAWTSVASSADGTRLVAAAGGYLGSGLVCRSTDAGATWTPTKAPGSPWKIVSSADGATLVGIGDGHMCVSRDSGKTWKLASSPTLKLSMGGIGLPEGGHWTTAAVSADGTQLVGAVGGGGIYTLQFAVRTQTGGLK